MNDERPSITAPSVGDIVKYTETNWHCSYEKLCVIMGLTFAALVITSLVVACFLYPGFIGLACLIIVANVFAVLVVHYCSIQHTRDTI